MGEPAIAGHRMLLEGTDTVVQTDDKGQYEFKNLPPGSYSVKSTDRAGFGQGWTANGGDSDAFRGANGTLRHPVVLKAGQRVTHLDSGFATAKVDYKAGQILIDNKNPKVGDVIEIAGSGYPDGNVHDRRSPGAYEFVGARVVVEKPLSAAEIKFTVWKGLFASTDPDTANDVITTTLTTS